MFAGFGFYIKIIGIGFSVLFLFYKNKLKFIISLVVIMSALFFVPLFFMKFDLNYLLYLYTQWYEWLFGHYCNGMNVFFNVFSVLEMWFHCGFYSAKKIPLFYIIQFGSLLVLALPLLRVSKYKEQSFRLMFLGSVLMWVTLFNPRAESATYAIAMTGVAFWFISQKITPFTLIVLFFAIIITSLSATDLFPHDIRVYIIQKYKIKVFPCFLIWIIAQVQLLSMKDFGYTCLSNFENNKKSNYKN